MVRLKPGLTHWDPNDCCDPVEALIEEQAALLYEIEVLREGVGALIDRDRWRKIEDLMTDCSHEVMYDSPKFAGVYRRQTWCAVCGLQLTFIIEPETQHLVRIVP